MLQFAAAINEEAAAAAAAQLALPAAWEHAGCLLGAADGGAAGCSEERWEQVGRGTVMPWACLLLSPPGTWKRASQPAWLCLQASFQPPASPHFLPCLPPAPPGLKVVSQSEGGLTYEVWRQSLRGELLPRLPASPCCMAFHPSACLPPRRAAAARCSAAARTRHAACSLAVCFIGFCSAATPPPRVSCPPAHACPAPSAPCATQAACSCTAAARCSAAWRRATCAPSTWTTMRGEWPPESALWICVGCPRICCGWAGLGSWAKPACLPACLLQPLAPLVLARSG